MQQRPDHSKKPATAATKSPAFLTIFPSIMLPMFLAVVDQTIVATALPAIAAGTGEVERASWIVVAYLIASTIAAPIYGRLGDSFGRRRLMFVALPVFMVASLLCAASPTVELLTLARVLQGLGGGGLMTLSQALIGEAIPPRERARYQGYLAAVAVCANSFGPVAGGYLTEHFGWPSIFLVNVPIGLGALALVWRLPNPIVERVPWRADPGGLFLFTVFVATTLLALEQIQHVDLAALPLGGALFAVALIAVVLLVRYENRTPSPLIPLKLLRQPAIWHSDALAACHGAALVSLITFLPIYLEVVRGLSPSDTGLLLVPLTIGIGAGSLMTGRMVSKTGLTTVYPVAGLALATVNFIVLAFWASSLSATATGRRHVAERPVHGHGDGRRAGQRAKRRGSGAARRGGGVGAVLALDRRRHRHRAGRHHSVRPARAQKPGSGPCLCRHDRDPPGGAGADRRSTGDPGRYPGGVRRRLPDHGGLHHRGLFARAHQSAAADLAA